MSCSSSGSSKASRRPQRSQIAWWWCSPTGVGGLVAGGAVDVDAPDEPEPRQHVDRPVDAGEPDGALLVAEPVVDRLGAEAALLAGEQVEDLLARAARAVARAGELALRVGLPFGLRSMRHSLAHLQMRISFSIVVRRR